MRSFIPGLLLKPFFIEIAFGEYYRELEDEKGKRKDLVNVLDEVSPEQKAQEDIGKSGETINKYARIE